MRWTARDFRSLATGLAYLGPSLILFAAFVFIPLAQSIYLSFFNTRATLACQHLPDADEEMNSASTAEVSTG